MRRHVWIVGLAAAYCIAQPAAAQSWSEPQVLFRQRLAEPVVATGGGDILHLVWAEETDFKPLRDSIFYTTISKGRASAPVFVAPDSGIVVWPVVRLVISSDDIPHLVWGENQRYLQTSRAKIHRLLHVSLRDTSPRPDTLVDYSTGFIPPTYDLCITRHNRLYVSWHTSSRLWLRTRTEEGWTTALSLFPTFSPSNADMFVGSADSLHMVFLGYVDFPSPGSGWQNINHIYYSVKKETDNLWRKPVVVYYNPRTIPAWPQILVDATGTRHILWQEDLDQNLAPDGLFYSFSHDGKNWSEPRDLSRMGEFPYSPQMVVDRRNTLHVLWSQIEFPGLGGTAQGICYTFGREDSWSEPEVIFEAVPLPFPKIGIQISAISLAIDSWDRLHLVWLQGPGPSWWIYGDPFVPIKPFFAIKYSWRDVVPTAVVLDRQALKGQRQQAFAVTAYPNPFNDTATFLISSQREASVSFRIYNISGQLVKTLLDAKPLPRETSLTWNGCDEEGRPLPSGVYLCQAKAKSGGETFEVVSKVLLVR